MNKIVKQKRVCETVINKNFFCSKVPSNVGSKFLVIKHCTVNTVKDMADNDNDPQYVAFSIKTTKFIMIFSKC